MKRRLCLICAVVAACLEPVAHAFGLGHPEGLPALLLQIADSE